MLVLNQLKNQNVVKSLRLEVIQELNKSYCDWHKLFTDGSKCGSDQGLLFMIHFVKLLYVIRLIAIYQ